MGDVIREIHPGSAILYGDIVAVTLRPCLHIVRLTKKEYLEVMSAPETSIKCPDCSSTEQKPPRRAPDFLPLLLVFGVCAMAVALGNGPSWLRVINAILGFSLLVVYDECRRKRL